MKKLNLGKLKLASDEVLQRSQLAGVYGGSGSSGTCGWNPPGGGAFCGISYQAAISNFQLYGGNWCCDSCGTTGYCGSGSGW